MHESFKGRMISKKGMEVSMATLADGVDSPSMRFNLCSMSRHMKNGWKMSG